MLCEYSPQLHWMWLESSRPYYLKGDPYHWYRTSPAIFVIFCLSSWLVCHLRAHLKPLVIILHAVRDISLWGVSGPPWCREVPVSRLVSGRNSSIANCLFVFIWKFLRVKYHVFIKTVFMGFFILSIDNQTGWMPPWNPSGHHRTIVLRVLRGPLIVLPHYAERR